MEKEMKKTQAKYKKGEKLIWILTILTALFMPVSLIIFFMYGV